MPPRKRKASSAASTPAGSKRVRIGDESTIGDSAVTAAGRLRRSTSNDNPQYTSKRSRGAGTGGVDKQDAGAASSAAAPATKGRGRPKGKAATTQAAKVEDTPAPKKRGRPPKMKLPEPEPEEDEDSEEEVVATPVKAKPGRKGILKNKDVVYQAAAEPEVDGAGKRKRGKVQPAAEIEIKSQKKHGRPAKKDRMQDDGLTDEEALNKGAAALVHENIDPEVQYWLMKAEPESRIEKGVDVKFSIDDLREKQEPEGWDGVRNPVARNNMRAMRLNDLAFFYHSNCKKPAVVGIMRIVDEHQVDESAFDPDHPYYDPKSDRAKPKWELVKVEHVHTFSRPIGLKELRTFSQEGGALEQMQMLRQSRLSVSPVRPSEWRFILELAGEEISLGQPSKAGGYEGDTDGEVEEDEGGKFGFASSFEADAAAAVNGVNGVEGESSSEEVVVTGGGDTSESESGTDVHHHGSGNDPDADAQQYTTVSLGDGLGKDELS